MLDGDWKVRALPTYFEEVDRIHHRMLLGRNQPDIGEASGSQTLTAMPAKAPASMFAASEKFGGNDSYLRNTLGSN